MHYSDHTFTIIGCKHPFYYYTRYFQIGFSKIHQGLNIRVNILIFSHFHNAVCLSRIKHSKSALYTTSCRMVVKSLYIRIKEKRVFLFMRFDY